MAAFLGLSFCWADFAKGKIIINEIIFDPKGADEGKEWIELYNTGEEDVFLDGWDIDPDSGNYFKLDGLMIRSGQLLLLEGFGKMRNERGQVALYSSTKHVAENMADYVQYGSWDLGSTENKVRERAVAAGIWKEEDFVVIGKEGDSIALYPGERCSDSAEDWETYPQGGTPGVFNKKYEKKEEESDGGELFGKLLISELFPNPREKGDVGEFIELYNGLGKEVSLRELTLTDKSCQAELEGSDWPEEVSVVGSGEYAYFDADALGITLANSKDAVRLCAKEQELAKVEYASAKEGLSYSFDGKRWRWTKFLTPGKANIFNNEPQGTLKIDEDVYKDVYASFAVSTGDADGDKVTVSWDFGDGRRSYKAQTRHKYKEEGSYQASVQISDGSEDVIIPFKVKVKEFPRRKVRIVEVSPNPVGSDTENEYVLLLNKSEKEVNLKGWSLATGRNSSKLVNHPIREDFVIKGGKTKILTRDLCAFSLGNEKGRLELRYPDGEQAHTAKYKAPGKSVEEGEIYRKIEGGWEWVAGKNKKSKVESEKESEEVEGGEEVLEIESAAKKEAELENIGKQSVLGAQKRFAGEVAEFYCCKHVPGLAAYMSAEAKGKVFAYAFSYRFVPEAAIPEHYAVRFWRGFSAKTRYLWDFSQLRAED